ncbi:MAG: hypothetical protein JXM79_08785 [Sedimentisphaerales bacterium]|nr:hypothetical protein [Sedimentisphaerales bacterium]
MNDNEKYIQNFVKDVPFDAPNPKHRDELKKQLLNAFPRHRLQPTGQPVSLWRTIMKSRITKLAAAAVIVLAASLTLTFFNQTSGIVWADVVKRLEAIKTGTYKITADIKGMPGTPEDYVTHIVQDVTLSYEQNAVRIDTSIQVPNGTKKSRTYLLFEDRVLTSLMLDQKKYIEVTIGEEQMQKMSEENGDPATILKAMLERDYTELGRQTIDGIPAWGIEASDPKLGTKMGSLISSGMFDEMTVQLWVDEKNECPIRLIATGASKDGQTSMKTIYDNFQWNTDIDPALLEPEIPDDFELLVQGQWETGQEAEEIIDVLRLFVELADGQYPASLKTMTVVQAIVPLLKKKYPPSSPKPDKEILNRYMKVERIGLNYTTLEKDGKEPAYYGDRVSIETPQAVLFRWKIDENTYRVVFGDLSTKDVTPAELAELEAALPNTQQD